MRIKQLADKVGVTPRAIRFYEEKGLLSPTKNEDNSYREFTDTDAWRLQTIVALREVGMPLNAVERVFAQLDDGERADVADVLEWQRALMFSQFIGIKQMIETTEQMIEVLRRNESLDVAPLYQLAEGSKRMRMARENWSDRWNFDERAEYYDEDVHRAEGVFRLHTDYETGLDTVASWINAKAGEFGLDFGTGTGNLAGRLLAPGIHMAGIDQSRAMLSRCRQKYPDVETKLGSFFSIPFFDSTFDFVVSSYAFHHLTDVQKELALQEMSRVLKPHGRICIADLMFHNSEHRHTYLQSLAKAGEVETIAIVENEFLADRSRLLQWFRDNGYITEERQVTELLHALLAVKTR